MTSPSLLRAYLSVPVRQTEQRLRYYSEPGLSIPVHQTEQRLRYYSEPGYRFPFTRLSNVSVTIPSL